MKHITLFLAFVAVLGGCQTEPSTELTADQKVAIIEEIHHTLEDYRMAVIAKDLTQMLDFWSNSEDFVFAGDGRILGGYEEWAAETTKHTRQTEEWLDWEYRNIHVAVLSKEAASCTLEFEFSSQLVDGDSLHMKGAWTYVFRRDPDRWRVIQTNGTHLEL